MTKTIFTDEQAEFIRVNALKMTNKEMAEKLGFPVSKIKGRVDSQRLRAGTKKVSFSKKDIETIKKLYNNVETAIIAKQLGKSTKQISDKAYNMGLKRLVNKHSCSEAYFEVIDTEEKAYWLGFMYADGYVYEQMNKNTGNHKFTETGIALQGRDAPHLEKFIKAINGSQKVCHTISRCKGKVFSRAKVSVYGEEFARHLKNNGCTPRKSLTLSFPDEDIVPSELLKHFIRGYIDGDGCLFVEDSKYVSYIVNIVGTENFLNGIGDYFNSVLGINRKKLYKKGNAFQIQFGGKNVFDTITNHLYRDAKVFLDRKYEIFDSFNKKIA